MHSIILIATLVGAASAQFTPFSGAFGSGLSPFAGSPLGAYSSFRPFSGFAGASGLSNMYGGSPSMYGSASTSHPYYGSSPYGAAPSSGGAYPSSPYTTSFSSQPQYSASLGSPHTMSKDPEDPKPQTSASSIYDRLPGMGGGLISNLFRHRRPSLFNFRRGQPNPDPKRNRLRPQNPVLAPGVNRFQFHPLPEPQNPFPPPYAYPNPGHYSGHFPDPSHEPGPLAGSYDSEPASPSDRVADRERDHDRDREY